MKHKRNITNTNPPLAGEIEEGQIAIGMVDGRLFTKDHLGNVISVGGDVYSVDTIAGLATAPLTRTVFVKEPLRGGLFVYDAARAAENDDGTVFNGWVRRYEGHVSVLWFGAVGDNATASGAKIQEAIDVVAAKGGGVVSIPHGIYLTDQTITIKDDVILMGENSTAWDPNHSTLIKGNAASPIVSIGDASNNQGFGLHRVAVDGIDKTVDGVKCHSGTNDIKMSEITVHNCTKGYVLDRCWTLDANRLSSHSCTNGFEFRGTGMTSLTFNNCGAYNSANIGWNFLADGITYSTFTNCFVDFAKTGLYYSGFTKGVMFNTIGFEHVEDTIIGVNNASANLWFSNIDFGTHKTNGTTFLNLTSFDTITISDSKCYDSQLFDADPAKRGVFSTFGSGMDYKATMIGCSISVNQDLSSFNIIGTRLGGSGDYGMLSIKGVDLTAPDPEVEISSSNRDHTFTHHGKEFNFSSEAAAANQAMAGSPIIDASKYAVGDIIMVKNTGISNYDIILRGEPHTSGTGIVVHPLNGENDISLSGKGSYTSLIRLQDGKLHEMRESS